MATVSSAIDRELLSRLRTGDEQALELAFHDRYPALETLARSELPGDEAMAPKVVERAFLQLWHDRDQVQTPEELDARLRSCVHEFALREKSRRASVHRFEAREGVQVAAKQAPTTTSADAWAHLVRTLHAPPPDAAASAGKRREMSRHGAAEHMAEVARPKPWAVPLAIAAVLAAVVFGAMRWADRTSVDMALTRALADPEARVTATRAAQRGRIDLGGGVTMDVGPESKVTLPKEYGGNLRAARIDGAALVTVAAGSPPFVLRAGPASVTSTGATFGVRAYPGEGDVMLRVRDGSVAVTAGEQTQTVAAGSALSVASAGAMTAPASAASTDAFGWMDGRYVATDRPLRDVLPQLTRWYALDLTTADPALLTRPVRMNVPLDSSRAALAALESSANVRFAWEGRKMVLRDAGATPPGAAPAAGARPATTP